MSTLTLPKLSLDSDVVFRRLFDEEPLLLSLLNALLHVPPDHRLTELTILPTHVAGPLASDKEVVLDLRAQTQSGRQFHIELQVRPFLSYPERALFYWAGLYQGQLEAGQGYQHLQPVISIHILHFSLLPSDEHSAHFHHVYELRERRTGHRFSEHLEIHTIEMGKFDRERPALATEEERWLYFLKKGHQMTPDEIEELDMPEIKSAEEKLRVISQERLLRIEHEGRQKAERDAIAWEQDHISAWLKEGRRLGVDEGRRLGVDEGRRLGVDEGRRLGVDEGRRLGLDEGRKDSILRLLALRGLDLGPELRARILACHDPALLDRYLARAATAATTADVFAEP